MNKETIETVSPDVLKLITAKLDPPSIAKWCLTSKRFKKIICDSDSVWVNIIKKDDGVDITKLKRNYINRYIKQYQIRNEILELIKERLSTDDDILRQEIDEPKNVTKYYTSNYNLTTSGLIPRDVSLNIRIKILLAEYLKLATQAQNIFVNHFDLVVSYWGHLGFNLVVKKEGLSDHNVGITLVKEIIKVQSGSNSSGIYSSDVFKILSYVTEQSENKGPFYNLMSDIRQEIKTLGNQRG